MTRAYWLDFFTYSTCQVFFELIGICLDSASKGGKTVQQVKPGDYLLCYLICNSRWIDALEVVSPSSKDHTQIWKEGDFHSRIKSRSRN